MVFFFHSPPNQSEGPARRGGGEWKGRGSFSSASGALRDSCLCGRRVRGEGVRILGRCSVHRPQPHTGSPSAQEPQLPGGVPSAHGQVCSGPWTALLSNYIMKPGCFAAGSRLCYCDPPPGINKPITHSARLGFIYVDLDWGTSEGIINTDTGLLSQEGG